MMMPVTMHGAYGRIVARAFLPSKTVEDLFEE
jgi:hypothetical protein